MTGPQRVALVVGSAGGIGRAIAERLVEGGCKVVPADLARQEPLGTMVGVKLDVTDAQSWADVVGAVAGQLGRIDILVNAAGIFDVASLEDTTEEDYRKIIDVNQVGTFLGMQAAAAALGASSTGPGTPGATSIVNIASIAGLRGGVGMTAYAASKAAVIAMTQTAALELAPRGVRVNAVCPGGIDTPMARTGVMEGRDWAKTYARQAVPRIGTPREVADVVAFLASPEAAFVTGAAWSIDGGALLGRAPHG